LPQYAGRGNSDFNRRPSRLLRTTVRKPVGLRARCCDRS